MSDPELRPLPPLTRNGSPRWAVYLEGQQIGEIRQTKLSGARLPFYEAIVKHPTTGKPLSLELHTEIENRLEVIVAFHRDPMTARQHWR